MVVGGLFADTFRIPIGQHLLSSHCVCVRLCLCVGVVLSVNPVARAMPNSPLPNSHLSPPTSGAHLCRVYKCSAEDLHNKWESFSMQQQHSVERSRDDQTDDDDPSQLTKEMFEKFKVHLQREREKALGNAQHSTTITTSMTTTSTGGGLSGGGVAPKRLSQGFLAPSGKSTSSLVQPLQISKKMAANGTVHNKQSFESLYVGPISCPARLFHPTSLPLPLPLPLRPPSTPKYI